MLIILHCSYVCVLISVFFLFLERTRSGLGLPERTGNRMPVSCRSRSGSFILVCPTVDHHRQSLDVRHVWRSARTVSKEFKT